MEAVDGILALKGAERFELTREGRGKDFTATSKYAFIHTVDTNSSAAYYTQFAAVAVLGFSVRVGFNPGELLDFMLGFAALDIYGDDARRNGIKREKRRTAADSTCPPNP